MVEKSQDKEMDKSVAVGNVENNSEKNFLTFFKIGWYRTIIVGRLLTYTRVSFKGPF